MGAPYEMGVGCQIGLVLGTKIRGILCLCFRMVSYVSAGYCPYPKAGDSILSLAHQAHRARAALGGQWLRGFARDPQWHDTHAALKMEARL